MCLHGDIYPECAGHTRYTHPVGTEGGETPAFQNTQSERKTEVKAGVLNGEWLDCSNTCEAEEVVPESDP